MNPWLVSIPLAYLLGSIPCGYLLVRFVRRQDIRASGSGNIGATNVARSGARGLAMLTLVLDLSKTFLAVMLARRFAPGNFDLAVVAALSAMLGYVFPVWLGFRGGKGVAGGLGVFLALAPWIALCALGIFLIVVTTSRYVSLASIVASLSLPLFSLLFLRHASPMTIFGFLFIPLLICVRHQKNIERLRSGTESRFGRDRVGKAAA